MIGLWFHSFTNSVVKWQGQIKKKIVDQSGETTHYYVQLYEWLDGAESNCEIVAVEDMLNWQFYNNAEQMNEWYYAHNGKKDNRDEFPRKFVNWEC